MNNYVELAVRTESTQFNIDKDSQRLLHGAIGLATESGEILDALKKSIYYGRELDLRNLKEELGDVMWYIAILCDAMDYSLDDAQRDNIEKLKKRYPEGFKDVLTRDQEAELSHIKVEKEQMRNDLYGQP